jgi:hypothetical protein
MIKIFLTKSSITSIHTDFSWVIKEIMSKDEN